MLNVKDWFKKVGKNKTDVEESEPILRRSSSDGMEISFRGFHGRHDSFSFVFSFSVSLLACCGYGDPAVVCE